MNNPGFSSIYLANTTSNSSPFFVASSLIWLINLSFSFHCNQSLSLSLVNFSSRFCLSFSHVFISTLIAVISLLFAIFFSSSAISAKSSAVSPNSFCLLFISSCFTTVSWVSLCFPSNAELTQAPMSALPSHSKDAYAAALPLSFSFFLYASL